MLHAKKMRGCLRVCVCARARTRHRYVFVRICICIFYGGHSDVGDDSADSEDSPM